MTWWPWCKTSLELTLHVQCGDKKKRERTRGGGGGGRISVHFFYLTVEVQITDLWIVCVRYNWHADSFERKSRISFFLKKIQFLLYFLLWQIYSSQSSQLFLFNGRKSWQAVQQSSDRQRDLRTVTRRLVFPAGKVPSSAPGNENHPWLLREK